MGNGSDKIKLIVRADDMGMTHSCNIAIEKCFEEGILTCAAIQAPAPWAGEAAIMARKHPEWCIGVHLTTLGEWVGYRWRPVLPYDRVSSLVDENGFLHQTINGFYSKDIDYDQLEKEFMAQVDLLANKWGVKLSYLDTHYIDGDNTNDKNYREVVKRVAASFGLPISGKVGEKGLKGVFTEPVWSKENALVNQLKELTPGLWLHVSHILTDTVESHSLVYANPSDFVKGGVGNHRVAEGNALLSQRVKDAIVERQIELVDYRTI